MAIVVKSLSARSAPRIYVSTLRGRALYYYFTLLKGTGLQFKAVVPGGKVEEGAIYLTTKGEAKESQNAIFYEDLTRDVLVDRVLLYTRLFRSNEAVIGIDPGKTIGVAITVRGIPAGFLALSDAKELEDVVVKLQRKLKSLYIKVGDGDQRIYTEIVDLLRGHIRETDSLAVVSERNTTPKGRAGHRKDINAALKIALRGV